MSQLIKPQLTYINSNYSYYSGEVIGSGFKSQVYKGINNFTKELVAIKVVDLTALTHEVEKNLLNQEVAALRLLDSPNIVKLYDSFYVANHLVMVMEYCDQGDLAQVVKAKPIDERYAVPIFAQILNGFKEQIAKRIIHRDLKPSNVLIKQSQMKIADYGFSKMMNAPKEKVYYNVGTALYMSPQALIENRYSEKSDIWSLGVIMYQVVCGKVPWQAPTEKEFIKVITTTPAVFPSEVHISASLKDLILKCLNTDEDRRLNTRQIEEHPVFNARIPRERMSHSTSFHQQLRHTFIISQKLLGNPASQGNQGSQGSQHRAARGLHSPRQERNLHILQQNEQCILNIVYLTKFIMRIARLIDHFEFLRTCSFGLEEKCLFFTIKHALFKLGQLRVMIEQKTNTLNLPDFQYFIDRGTLLYHYQAEITQLHTKFRQSFNKLWFRINESPDLSQVLKSDRNFCVVFDENDLESPCFYLFMSHTLRQTIREMKQGLTLKFTERIDIQPETEAAIILLDYLVSYYMVCEDMIANPEKSFSFPFSFKDTVEAKRSVVSFETFIQICQKTIELRI